MEHAATPTGGSAALKFPLSDTAAVELRPEDVARAEMLLRHARHATGLAAYQFFFRDDTPDARAAYLAALEAEVEAQLLLEEMTERRPSDA